MFGSSPFPCVPAVKAWLLRESVGRGSIALIHLQVGTLRLLSALKRGHFSSDFPRHPPLSPSVLLPCPLLQDSCCALILTSDPSPCPPGPARQGRHLSFCLLRLFPIHFVHRHMKDCLGSLGISCTSWATSAKRCSRLSPPGPGRCPSPAGTLHHHLFISSFITRVGS